MKRNDKDKLRIWQDRFHRSKTDYESVLTAMEDRQRQYRGDRKLRNSGQSDEPRETCHVWNITAENIDSEIDSVIPPCKVTPKRKEDEYLAKKIEQMIRSEMDRMPVEELNDICERTVKVQGGVIFLPEWNNGRRTHTTVGEIVLSHIHPKQFIPQSGVNNIDDMDYYFILLPQTKESIRRQYGVTVHEEAEEFPEARSFDASAADDMVTLILAHYRNDSGFVGVFGWVGDTIVVDFEDYMARQHKRCRKCGQLQNREMIALDRPIEKDGSFPQGAGRRKDGKCAYCAGELENVTEDVLTVRLSDLELLGMPPSVIQELRQKAKQSGGEWLPPMLLDRLSPMGMPMEQGMAMAQQAATMEGLPMVAAQQTATMEGLPMAMPMPGEDIQIEIPYFKPESYPAVLQRNITTFGEFLGESDCDKIADQQNTVNRINHKLVSRVLDAGSVIALPSDTTFTTDRQDRKQWRFKNAAEIQMVKQFDFTGDIAPHMAVLQQAYEESRRVLGITDSFQGRKDSTATSGKAKEFAAAQSAGRLESKKVLKAACWQRIYKRIFELMLAYCDEKRAMVTAQADGSNLYGEWNKWEFLKVDDAGEIYWNTDFIFSTDDASALAQNRMALWQEATTHLSSGAYGNPSDIRTLITFWEAMSENHYPGAETIAAQLKERAQAQAQMAMQQAPQAQQMPPM